jgi:hypothetical protein
MMPPNKVSVSWRFGELTIMRLQSEGDSSIMHNEKLRMLLSDAEAVCDRAADAIDLVDEDDFEDDEDDDDTGFRTIRLNRLRWSARELGDVVERLRDVRLAVDREIEELR